MNDPLIDPAVLTRVAKLNFRLKQVMEGTLSGAHRSPHHGSSVEFAQHKEYCPGDEIRHIDWRAYAKSDRYYVKQYEDETNLRAYLLLDTSGSMGYAGEARPTKARYAAQLAAALSWVLLRQGDAVGLQIFGDRSGAYIPPRARLDHFHNLVKVMSGAPIGGATDAVGALARMAEVAARRSVVILLSDCFDFSGRVAAMAKQLRRHRHRVLVLQVLDPDEWGFPFKDLTLFEDLESEAVELADPRGMREQYLVELRGFCDTLRRELLDGDVAYQRVMTDMPVDRVLFKLLGGL